MRYSPSTGGFYPESIAYLTLPNDLVTITDEEYLALLAAQAEGKGIVAVNGRPSAQTPAGPTIEQKRNGAFMSRPDFCIRLTSTELSDPPILSEADAETASDGTWPPSFTPFIAALPLAGRIAARAKWADEKYIYYTDPLLQDIALAVTGSEAGRTALLDALFGIT